MNLALTFDEEFKRVAKAEDISMEELVTEVSRLVGCSARQVYNYRSGKWLLPGQFIPALCKRFGSLALLHALAEGCCMKPVEVPESYDLTKMVTQTVRDDMGFYSRYLDAFESDGFDRNELESLLAAGERVIQNVRQFEEIATVDCERRTRVKSS